MNKTNWMSFPIVKDKRFYKNIFILAFPIVLQNLLRVSVDTADSIMLGRIDQLQMTAVSQAQQIFFIFYTLCNGFSAGATILIAQYWGKNSKDKIKTLFAIGVRSISIFAIIISILVILYPNVFMGIYSNDPEVIALGASYLRIAAFMYLPCSISTMLFACFRGVEQFGISFFTNVISYPLNILLNYCLIFGKFGFPELGINGAAFGTIIARLVELAILFYYLFFREKKLNFKFTDFFRRDKALARSYLMVSLPVIAHELIWSTGTSAGSAITGKLGKEVVGGFNVAYVLNALVATFMHGILHSCSVVIGKTIGSGESKENIRRQAHSAELIGFVGGIVLGVIMMIASIPFVSIYSLTPETRSYAFSFILIFAIIWPFSGHEMTGMIAALRAGGDGKTGFIADIFTMWLITIPLAALGAFKFNWSPIIVMVIIKFNIVLESIVGAWRIRSMKWIKNLTLD